MGDSFDRKLQMLDDLIKFNRGEYVVEEKEEDDESVKEHPFDYFRRMEREEKERTHNRIMDYAASNPYRGSFQLDTMKLRRHMDEYQYHQPKVEIITNPVYQPERLPRKTDALVGEMKGACEVVALGSGMILFIPIFFVIFVFVLMTAVFLISGMWSLDWTPWK